MLISVVLPAPFSPRSATTSPRRSAKEIASLAVSGPKRLVTPSSRRTTGAAAAPVIQLDAGSLSSISTTSSPDMICAWRSATMFIAASGTLPSKVPSGASEQPPLIMKE